MKKLIYIAVISVIFLFFVGLAINVNAPEHTSKQSDTTESTLDRTEDTEAPPVLPKKKIVDAPYIYQNIDYPNGCESVSAVMALQYFGMDITVDEFIDNYLDMGGLPKVGGVGPDPSRVFLGDPREKNSWGCYSPVIYNALGKYIDNSKYTVSLFSGRTLTDLCTTYIDNDIPVIVWATVGMVDSSADQWWASWTTPEGKNISYNKKLHCLLLVGYDEHNYYFNDSMHESEDGTSYTGYSKASVEKAYEILNRQSIVISPVIQNKTPRA